MVGVLPSVPSDPLRVFSETAAELGDLVWIGRGSDPTVGMQTTLRASHPDVAERILKKAHKRYVLLQKVLNDGLFTSEGDFCKRQCSRGSHRHDGDQWR